MELALEVELKATVIHEESEEFYVGWVKEDHATRKKFGLTVSYDIGWQRQSSGNNYASLSGHMFLIGVHTHCVIICVIFSKKCSVCENRRNKFSIKESFPTTTPTSPSGTINDPYVSTIQPNMSAHAVKRTRC